MYTTIPFRRPLSEEDEDASSVVDHARKLYDRGYGQIAGDVQREDSEPHPLTDDILKDLEEQATVLQPARRHDQIDPEYRFDRAVFDRLCLRAGQDDAQAALDRALLGTEDQASPSPSGPSLPGHSAPG